MDLQTQAIISICTWWASIGMGFKGIVLLTDFLPYQTKQTMKVKALQAQLIDGGIEMQDTQVSGGPQETFEALT